MRRYDEPVRVLFDEVPRQFIWRGRLLRVVEVQSRWRRSAPWWTTSQVQAVRGEQVDGVAPTDDLVREQEIWRVEAAGAARRGVYELACAVGEERWWLQAVCD